MTKTGILLELNALVKHFNPPAGGELVPLLRGIDLVVEAAETIAVTGPSGSGKSTLLNIIGALDRPSSGNVVIAGRNLSELDDAQLAHMRNQEVGFVFQLHHLLPQCTVFENILVPTLPFGAKGDRKDASDRAARLLKRVQLSNHADHLPAQLSGGERQRVAVVRALINRPKLLLADEPTGSLDHASAEALVDLLIELNREEQVAIVMVTHARDLAQRMSRVFELRDGLLHRQKREDGKGKTEEGR